MPSGGELDRRSFLVGASVTGGGLALGFAIPFVAPFGVPRAPTGRACERYLLGGHPA